MGIASTEILVARHAEYNVLKAVEEMKKTGIYGDPGLTQEGNIQSYTLSLYLKLEKITKIICSPARRARETAEIISKDLGIGINFMPDFDCVRFPEGEKLFVLIEKYENDKNFKWQDEWYNGFEGFETPQTIINRIEQGINVIKKDIPDDKILIVAHEETVWIMYYLT